MAHACPLPQVLLNAAPLLTPADVRTLAAGLCPSQSCNKAQLLLQEALEKQRSHVWAPGGSLVLVLDKVRACPCCFSLSSDSHSRSRLPFFLLLFPAQHLQKLPWESMACLRAVPVTRLPSLRFLLSYNLAPRVSGRGAPWLCRGAWDPRGWCWAGADS